MKNYIPLHVHSHYSVLDGLSKPEQIANRCLKIGAKACAITDHGNIAGTVKFHSVMRKNKIKPILGCELYICNHDATIKTNENKKLSHLVVLAKNYLGWKTLIKIISESNKPEHYYYKPRLDLKKLSELLDGNIIGFAGHLGSVLADCIMIEGNTIITDWKKTLFEKSIYMQDIFGKDNFFLEAQLMDSINNKSQIDVTNCIRQIAKDTGIKTICTPDAHYAEKDDAIDQRILLCNNLKTTLTNVNQKILNNEDFGMSTFFTSDNFHILDNEEINLLHTEEEIENTQYVNSLCEEYDITSKPQLPKFACPKDMNETNFLRELCRNGWREKIAGTLTEDQIQTYADRIKYELSVLEGANLSSYFLIVQDIVNYVRSKNWLPGPGRGSAAGCMVSYLIGITSINPIHYGLIFDRFYNAGRNSENYISMPDIDVDVPINKREDVINYIKEKYGSDKVSQMITFNTMKGRGALKDVLRAYGNITFEEMNNITKNIPDEAKIADELQDMKEEYGEASIIRWSLENKASELAEWCQLNDNGELIGPLSKRFEQAIRLEGTKTNQSKHAAGIAISQLPLGDVCPMVYDTKNDQLIAGMEMQDLENIGIVKFDILGVAMLDKVMMIRDILEKENNNG
jgi:DNA polymerase-3 subunit alpha